MDNNRAQGSGWRVPFSHFNRADRWALFCTTWLIDLRECEPSLTLPGTARLISLLIYINPVEGVGEDKECNACKDHQRKIFKAHFTSLKRISDEVHLPLGAGNAEYPLVVEAWQTHHDHVHLNPRAAQQTRRLTSKCHCAASWKKDSPWRFMKRMQLSTTTGICWPELWRRTHEERRMRGGHHGK